MPSGGTPLPRRLPVLLAVAVLLPAFPSAPAQAPESDHHSLNLNQPIALPGAQVFFSVHGRAGDVALAVHRLRDPEAVRDVAGAPDLPRDKVLERTLRIQAEGSWWSPGSWGSASDSLTLAEPGLYLVETVRGVSVQRAWLQVTTHSFLVKQGPEKAILHAFRLQDGEPLAGARVLVNGTEAGRTGADGILPLDPASLEGPVLVLADGAVSAGVLGLDSPWPGERARVVIHFDRPIYRPDQTVHLKVVTLEARGDRFVPYDAGAVRVKVMTYAKGGEDVVHEETLDPNAYGSVALSIPLREDAALGHYSVQVTTPGGAQGWASFQVEAYKKPRFEVEAAAARESYVSGEDVLVRASATWLFGSPLVRGTVSWRVSSFDYGYYPWHGRGCWSCGIGIMEDRSYAMPLDLSGEGQLNPDGTFLLTFRAPDRAWPARLQATVAVTSESGERQEGVAEITVHPAAYTLEVETDEWAYVKGAPVKASALVKHLSGAPAAGVPVSFTFREERGDRVRTALVPTDAGGRAEVVFETPTGGSYVLTASARDAGGRDARAERWVWVTDERVPWAGSERLTLLPERERYQAGETARILVLSSRPASVLVTVEGADLHSWQVVRVEGGTIVEVPVQAAHAPAVSVVATAVRMGEADQYGPDVSNAEAYLQVGPDPRELNVTILPEKPAYRDGDEARLLVQVRDAQGRPVEGEMALAVVDEAIHVLAPGAQPPLVDQVYPGARAVRTTYAWWSFRDSQWMVAGRLAFDTDERAVLNFSAAGAEASAPVAALSDSYKAFGGVPPAIVKVREDFPDTALWLPFLRTDATGTARVRLTAPDTLTEWRATGIVHTLDGLVGDATASFHTRKPLMGDLNAPRFLVQGDALNVTAVVFNHVGEMRDVEVQLVGEGAVKVQGSGYRRVTLSDGDSVRVDFPVVATDDVSGLANLTLLVLSGGATNESDAMRVKLPVLAHGVVQKAVRAGVDDATLRLPVPPGPYAAAPTVTVTLAPSMAATVLDALPYLLGYPYGCVEQTMSRFMPAVVATRALQDAGYDAQDPKLPEYVDAGLARLARFQHGDGGWGWWESDQTHPYMTAYVVAGLAEAKRAGAPVDAKMMERGVEALRKLYDQGGEADMRAYQAYALALAGAPPSAWPDASGLSLDGVALLGLGKLAAGDRAGAQAALDRLMEKAIRTEGRLHWEGESVHWGLHGIRSDVQLTAHALRLLVGLGKDADAPLVVSWLADKRAGAYWSTTKDTSESVLAIVDYVREARELNPDYDALVTVAGETFTVPFHGDAKDLERRTLQVKVPAALAGGEVPIEVKRQGAGRLYWSAVLSATPHQESIPPADHGIAVTKRIVDDSGNDVRTLKFNEEYTIVVTTRTPTERSHVLLHDPLPAGVEVVKTSARMSAPWARVILCWECSGSFGWPWSNVEVRDDHVAAFATTLPSGETQLSYRVRAVHPGSYHVLPATVEEMYAPDVNGRSADLHVAVGDVPRLLLGDALVTEGRVSLRVFPMGGQAVRVEQLVVDVVDEEGGILPLAQAPEVVLLTDGSLNVTVSTELPLPESFTVRLGMPQEPPATRVFRLGGAPATFDGSFPTALAAAWSAGPVVDATTATTRSDPAAEFPDPLIQREDPPGPAPPTGPTPTPAPPGETSPIPGLGLLATVAVAAVGAMVVGRKRRG